MFISKRNKWVAGISVFLLLAVLSIVFMGKNHSLSSGNSKQIVKDLPESFTFFDLGANTRYSSDIRSSLSQRLGPDAVAYQSQIELIINGPEFTQAFFPELYALNLRLNDPPRERIEHQTVKLMYRYSRKVDAPFKYVEMVFSGYSQRPLYFNIVVSHDGSGIIDALQQKYGQAAVLRDAKTPPTVRFWKKNNDLLLISDKSDRLGNPEYHIMIYYVNSLEELLSIEKEEARQRQDRIKQASDKAF